jgi:lipopolysaccharide/colanic/teichoic acid biosynthesis glycosyltransferase
LQAHTTAPSTANLTAAAIGLDPDAAIALADDAPGRVPVIPLPAWKRAFDLAVAGSLLIVAGPVMAVVATISRIVLGPGVLYRQARGGLGGAPFDIVKFRTMTNGRDADGNLLPDDQRRSRWGNLLRKTSLDELPALVNIARGEMSIVGPRPLMARYLTRYNEVEARRHCVTPGLTGLAQTQGRNTLTWQEKFALDLEYVETRSLVVDLRILRDTVTAVLSAEGADGNDHTGEFFGTPDDNSAADDDIIDLTAGSLSDDLGISVAGN